MEHRPGGTQDLGGVAGREVVLSSDRDGCVARTGLRPLAARACWGPPSMTCRPALCTGAFAGEPWFRRRPRLALTIIAALYVAVLTTRLLTDTPTDAFSMLYVLPVALAAAAFGQRVGVAASLLAVALIGTWVSVRHVHLTPTGWATRVVPILLLGFLLGGAMDRLHRAEADRRRMERAVLLHHRPSRSTTPSSSR